MIDTGCYAAAMTDKRHKLNAADLLAEIERLRCERDALRRWLCEACTRQPRHSTQLRLNCFGLTSDLGHLTDVTAG